MPRVADPDRGVGHAQPNKRTEMLDKTEFDDRAATREGARELDEMVESMPGLTRQQRDRERAMPRPTVAPEGHPRKQRKLPAPGDVRQPLSARQRKDRSKTKVVAFGKLRGTEYSEMVKSVQDQDHWNRCNNELSATVGQVQMLDDDLRTSIQRRDRAIQAYERLNDRSHVLYSNLELPASVNSGNVERFVAKHFEAGREVHFDRYTAAAHTVHEVERAAARGFEPVIELSTRRGMYLGGSGGVDDTRHMVARGLVGRVVGHHVGPFERPDGSTGQALFIQVEDITEGDES